ncbi:DNA-binding protein RFX5 isoform X1 [Anguilla anguilla]|uniref:DNA-binding protein RFX5 isoform X1 n=2 Tax=Anguilla anguilla TaxID=7936 RepID=UPI0015AE2BA8|nr:DNA-binding protein RFX5 isoform X1 [Anguilla anguilla]
MFFRIQISRWWYPDAGFYGDERKAMAEDGPQAAMPSRDAPRLDLAEVGSEPSMLLRKLRSNISKNIQSKVDFILQEVQRFSDSDKLYLYLQLPSGPGTTEKSGGDSNSFNTSDQLHACNWIRSHLEEHADTCLPKQDVYEAYRRYCDNLQYRSLSAANFGKIIRDIFPNIKARRLGGRGQSKYCYSGIRRKSVLNMPLLPSLDLKNDPSELTELVQTYKQEVTEAACELICDWAQKILKRSFDTVVEIARFLVQEHIVNPRCSQAELITSAALAGGSPKPHKVIKRNVAPAKGGGADGEGGGPENKKDRERGDQASPGKPAHGEKPVKGAEGGRGTAGGAGAGGRDLQVEAVMKRYPQLLPRGSVPDKTPPPACARSSPPPLAPKDALKVTLPITMTTLPQQPGGATAVFNMILPSGVSLSYPEREKAPPVTVTTTPGPAPSPSVLQKSRLAAPKRAPDPSPVDVAGATPMKRKRGRPRKPRPEEAGQLLPPSPAGHTLSPFTGGVIQKASSSSSSSSSSSLAPQPPQQPPQPEIMEIVIQDQHIRFLSAVPASSLEAPPLPATGGGATAVTDSPQGQQKSVVVQCYRPGASGDARPTLEGPLVLQSPCGQPAKPGGPSWGVGGATVEVIRRAPMAREAKANPPPLSTLPEEKEQEQEEVEIILTPVDSLSEPPVTASASADAP